MTESDLYLRFAAWLDALLEHPIPANVVAFTVLLYEGTRSFHVQLAGSPSFDPNDDTWACEASYSSGENLFFIPRDVVSDKWELALDLTLKFATDYLAAGRYAPLLKSRAGMAVGFVDGDLYHVWPTAAA
jgi:hypothetical protein